jgi:transglutaminase-like putative cysteine protease
VGCTFAFETPQPVSAVLQVAPSGPNLQVQAERWDTDTEHHGYIDGFGNVAPGWERVQAIVDFVHGHLEWVAGASNPWTTAVDAYRAGQGVCRDFAHLAITFCRALNIPARYVFGYIPDVDVPPPAEPMDFAAWFEVYLDGAWHTFDARNNRRRVGRVIVGRGRDAVDVALITSFGPLTLTEFEVRAA